MKSICAAREAIGVCPPFLSRGSSPSFPTLLPAGGRVRNAGSAKRAVKRGRTVLLPWARTHARRREDPLPASLPPTNAVAGTVPRCGKWQRETGNRKGEVKGGWAGTSICVIVQIMQMVWTKAGSIDAGRPGQQCAAHAPAPPALFGPRIRQKLRIRRSTRRR